MGVFEPAPPVRRIDLGDEAEFDLGLLRVKPAECAVLLGAEREELQPRMMQVLVALAEARPSVVSRQRLIDRCWDGRVIGDDSLNRCILGLRHLARKFDPPPFAIETVARVGYRLTDAAAASPFWNARRALLFGGGLAAAACGAFAIAIFGGQHARGSAPPTIWVRGNANDDPSQKLAKQLAVKLAALQGTRSSAMRLLTDADREGHKPDYVIELGRDAAGTGAGLSLLGSDGALFWSKELPAQQRAADFQQQVAVTTATILGCAVEALDGSRPLTGSLLKTYLEACAASFDAKYDPLKTLSLFQRVVRASPGFVPGWTRLLTAETDAVSNVALSDAASLKPSLRSHIVAARKLQRDLPESYIAEFVLTPPSDYLTRGRLLDIGIARNPDHGSLRAERAVFLESVGRLDDAVQDAVQAVKLDPISPITRDTYIRVLAFAGRVEAAQAALEEADRLWPGASSVDAARYVVSLRVGDPRLALHMLRTGAVPTRDIALYTSFLEARIDRSPARIDAALGEARSALRNNPRAIIGYSQALAEFGRNDEWFALLSGWHRMDLVDDITDSLFRPAFHEIHRDPRFLRVADYLGLLGFWRTTGKWPDFCFEPGLPYDCKVEAARIRSEARIRPNR